MMNCPPPPDSLLNISCCHCSFTSLTFRAGYIIEMVRLAQPVVSVSVLLGNWTQSVIIILYTTLLGEIGNS